MSKKTRNRIIQAIILLVILGSVAYLSYNKYNDILDQTTEKLNEKIINFHFETFAQLSKVFIKDSNNSFVYKVCRDEKLRDNFEDMLTLIRISTIQNLFVVSRDKNKEYYFLLDSERNPKLHADLYEPFEPLGDFWNECYKEKKPKVFQHKNSKDLWLTVAYPIVQGNKTVAIIGADISHELDLNMQKKLREFSNFFLWIGLFSILWFIVLYIYTLYFRRKYYEGYTDPLTNVYNRKYLYDILIKKLSRNYQLFMVDINFFKKVNDTYGHDAGDYILKEVAQRMNNLMRDEDSLIRFGGEEFLIYTTKLTPQKSMEFAQRLRECVKKEPIVYNEIVCTITVSIGINPNATKDKSFTEMLKKADEALYKAKISGRDCVRASL
jgi:diguanylate cyclase (GGDEF)-like protein